MEHRTTDGLIQELEDERKLSNSLILFVIIFLVLGTLFEIIILGIAYFYADRVECNLLWCTFITERSVSENNITSSTNSVTYITQTSTSECYLNGRLINCSDIEKYTHANI
jgi:hypothetical protein